MIRYIFATLPGQIAFFLFILFASIAPAEVVHYTSDSSIILNPERGLIKLLTVSDATLPDVAALRAGNHTIAWGLIRLNNYYTTPTLPAAKINEIKRWLDAVKANRVKALLRIVYHETTTFSPPEASLSIQESHLDQLGSQVFSLYNDIIVAYQAGGIGAYGEWYYAPSAHTTAAARKQLIDKMFSVIPSDAFVMVRTPYYKQQYEAAGAAPSRVARLGHYNDCFLSSADDFGTYACYPWPGSCPSITNLENDVAADSAVVPVGGETCNDTSRNNCSNTESSMDYFGYSFINTAWYATIRSKWTSQGCFDNITNRLGYRFELVAATVPDHIEPGAGFTVSITVKNVGWAPMYYARPVYIRMMDNSNNEILSYLTDANPRDWLPNGSTYTLSHTFTAPASISSPAVSLALWIPDNLPANYGITEYAVQMANTGVWDASNGNNVLQSGIPIGTGGEEIGGDGTGGGGSGGSSSSWTQLAFDDFETGWGNYTDGGNDCSRSTRQTHAYQGRAAIDIQDDSGVASSFTLTQGIDIASPGYTELKIDFWYKPVSMDREEDFLLEYWDGVAWRTIAAWTRGTDFQNGNFYEASVLISESSNTPFPSDMKIRFRCDASNDSDDVYIDEIRISAR